jgi:asparagine synthase (glutamine-hydrolysing)
MPQQLAALRHRGPDAFGMFSGGAATIGEARLAVIDIITGDPPITNGDETIGAVLNGEIYGFKELRSKLIASGHTFRTSGDTEVLVHLARDHDPVDIARQLDGMFAFAIWDKRRSRLILGRDRLGKKPLYYWFDGSCLVFASEIKAILAHPSVPRRFNPNVLEDYLTFGYAPSPETFFQGIHCLPPAHILVFKPGGTITLERYWELPSPVADGYPRTSFTDSARQVRTGLERAVERRLVSDVPLGAFLSGGVDSSSIVAIMSRLMSEPVRTFTMGFNGKDGFDERPYARLVSSRFSTDHFEFVVEPDASNLMEQLIYHYDQPFGDSSALPTYLLAEETRKHVTVALCGDGGDELFAGYERFGAAILLSRLEKLPQLILGPVRTLVQSIPSNLLRGRVSSLVRLLSHTDEPLHYALRSWVSFVSSDWRAQLIKPGSTFATSDFDEIWLSSLGASLLDRLLLLNIQTYLLDDLLPKADRMSMAHGLEVRSPFLDVDLLATSFALAPSAKFRRITLKRVLKSAVSDLLPPEILYRRKHGFGVPVDRWFRTDLANYVRGMLCSKNASVRKLLRPEGIDQLVGLHLTGRNNNGHALWTLITLEGFLRMQGW